MFENVMDSFTKFDEDSPNHSQDIKGQSCEIK